MYRSMPTDRSIDVDTIGDFNRAESYLKGIE
jgi:CMP-N-acetylneuraminic acid synthetase